jgi:hypothetical protein
MSHTHARPKSLNVFPRELRVKGRLTTAMALLAAVCFFGLYFLSFIPHEHDCATEESAAESAACPLCHVASHQPVSTPEAHLVKPPIDPRPLGTLTIAPAAVYSFSRYLLPPLRPPPAHPY